MLKLQSIIVISIDPRNDISTHFGIDINSEHVDTEIYRPDPSIGIDEIKEIIASSKHRPLKSDTKTVVILDAEKMTLEAQNALLKILEEPPRYLSILLVCRHVQSIIETVISRCRIIRLTTAFTPVEVVEASSIKLFSATPIPNRLANIPPDTKTKEGAVAFCQSLIEECKLSLHKNPNKGTLHNYKVVNDCLHAVVHNANATMAVADAILRLQH